MNDIDHCESVAEYNRRQHRRFRDVMLATTSNPVLFESAGEFDRVLVYAHRGEVVRVFGWLGTQRFQWYVNEDSTEGDSIETRLYRAAKGAIHGKH